MVDGSPERGSLFIPRPTTAACGWWHYLLDCHATLAVTLERNGNGLRNKKIPHGDSGLHAV